MGFQTERKKYLSSSLFFGQGICCLESMAASGLRFEDRLEVASTYSPWKERIVLVLMENGIREFADQKLQPPQDATDLAAFNQKGM